MEQKFTNDDLTKAWETIQAAPKITLLTHQNPDGDGMSACAAMEHILLKLNKIVETIYPNQPEFFLKRESKNTLIGTHKQTPDLLISFDTANPERLYYPEEFKKIPLINIDHHLSNSVNGSINFIKIETSSTCEMFYELLQEWDPEMVDKYVAECLLYGILYDSQVFHTKSTYLSTLKTAANLMEKGADLYEIKEELLAHKDPAVIKFWGHLLSNVKITNNKKAAWVTITQEELKKYNLHMNSTVGLNNFLSQIAGIDIIAILQELETGEIKISLRSKKTNVNAIAKKFGGGGHFNASGATSKESLANLEKELVKIFEGI